MADKSERDEPVDCPPQGSPPVADEREALARDVDSQCSRRLLWRERARSRCLQSDRCPSRPRAPCRSGCCVRGHRPVREAAGDTCPKREVSGLAARRIPDKCIAVSVSAGRPLRARMGRHTSRRRQVEEQPLTTRCRLSQTLQTRTRRGCTECERRARKPKHNKTTAAMAGGEPSRFPLDRMNICRRPRPKASIAPENARRALRCLKLTTNGLDWLHGLATKAVSGLLELVRNRRDRRQLALNSVTRRISRPGTQRPRFRGLRSSGGRI